MTDFVGMRNLLGGMTDQEIFDMTWGKALGQSAMVKELGAMSTKSVQEVLRATPEWREKNAHTVHKAVEMTRKAMSYSGSSAAIPIIFDPEVIDLLNNETPFLSAVQHRGYAGAAVRVNNISARDAGIGYISESTSMDLSGDTGNDATVAPVSGTMKIDADVAQTSDFGQMAGEHYISLKDTNLGARIAEAGQRQEKALLYGYPALNGATGDPADANCFKGIHRTCIDGGTSVDKSGFAGNILKDIKREIATMLQSTYAISPADLRIFVSWDMHDRLQNHVRSPIVNVNEKQIDYGFPTLKISGVPVIAGHNIRAHTFQAAGPTPTTVGNAGDVFIVNTRADVVYEMAPMSIMPLARIGLAERVALFTFHTYLNRANAKFSRYLYSYPLP